MDEYSNIETSVIPYNQPEIEKVMKQILYANGVTDVLYEGSNVSQLTSIISYVIGTLNANTAINIQETLLPLATKRMNILFGARQLGYEPHAIKSYIYEITLFPLYDETKLIEDPLNPGEWIVDTENKEARTISLIKNTKFKAGDRYYYYVGETKPDAITVSNYDISHVYDKEATQGRPFEDITFTIEVVEGEMTTYLDDEMLQYTAIDYVENGETKTKQDYLVPYRDLEEDYGLQVYLSYIDDDGYTVIDELWEKSDNFLIDETFDYNKRKYIRKENIILQYPAIFFKFAGFGNGIRSGTQIKVNVLQSSGPDGESVSHFEIISAPDITLASEMKVLDSYKLIQRGRVEETDDEIKDNAIVFKNTANRAVTKYDYISITKRHTLVKEADAWGGEDEIVKQLGNVFISCTPFEQTRPIIKSDHAYSIDIGTPTHETDLVGIQRNWRNWYLNKDEQTLLFEYLNPYKILTMELNYRHPLYINFDYVIDVVKYNMSQPVDTTNSIIFYTINDFFVKHIEKYDAEYLNSNLQRVLDTVLEYKTGVNFSLKLSGTLCTDMIENDGTSEKIYTSLSWPYELIIGGSQLFSDRLPRIDGTFGFYNGYIEVNYKLLETQSTPIRKTDIIYYNSEEESNNIENGNKIGEYNLDITKGIIDVIWDFSLVSIDIIFGPPDETDNNTRAYTEFPISYYPFDNNLVNLPFGKNRMPRLRNVIFTTV